MRATSVALAAVAVAVAATLAACAPRGAASSSTGVGNRAGGGTAPPEGPLAGTFSATHTIGMVCDQPELCEEEATDELVVRTADGGAIDVSIELVQTNGHTCSFAQRLEPDPAAADRWRFLRDDDGEEGACDLTLTRHPDRIDVESEGCRYYCGARAHLAGSFPR